MKPMVYADLEYLLSVALLVSAMLGMGATLKPTDFLNVARAPQPIALMFLVQVVFAPLVAIGIARLLKLPPGVAIGLLLVAALPGGLFSNVITYFGKGNVALSVSATAPTSGTNIENVHYFIATINGEFIGYQAALQTGKHLNALHGAFDRNRNSTYHAYDILFVKMTEFAITQGLKTIDLGAVLNFTKQKMVNTKIEMSYFMFSRYQSIQLLFNLLLRYTKIQGMKQLKFRNTYTPNGG